MAFLEVTDLSKTFSTPTGPRHVLNHVSLSVARGEFVAIVGAMGCGKSTLLHTLAGLIQPDSGHVTIAGEPVTGVRMDASLVFQNHSLLPWLSAEENVRLAVESAFPDWSEAKQRDRTKQVLELVGLGQAMQRRPRQLSGGMRQRVAIARAFATEPALLFLDEPFGALDALTRETLQLELGRLCAVVERPVTTVMVTNSLDEALILSDRIISLTRGPGASVAASIPVNLPRPRRAGMTEDVETTMVRTAVIDALTSGREGTNLRCSSPHAHAAKAGALSPMVMPVEG